MKKIWKFDISNESIVEIPKDFKIIHAGLQHGSACIWVECEPESEKKRVLIQKVGTGFIVPDDSVHIFTYLDGLYVWHIYYKIME